MEKQEQKTELTKEDRQRIEQEALKEWKGFGVAEGAFIQGAEYATLFERQQQIEYAWKETESIHELIKVDPATRAFYEFIRQGWSIATLFTEMTKYYRGIQPNSLGNIFHEAERTELRNKVIEVLNGMCLYWEWQINDPKFKEYVEAKELLNSLKTK